jgi:hypothetical protein
MDGTEFLATEFHERSPSACLCGLETGSALGCVASNAVRNYLPELSSHALMGVRGISYHSGSDRNFPQANIFVPITYQ